MFRGLIEGDMTAHGSTAPPNHWHHLHAEEVLRLLDVDLKAGLSAVEVKRRLEKFGPNVVRPRRGTPAWLKFLQQFNQPLVFILLAFAPQGGILSGSKRRCRG